MSLSKRKFSWMMLTTATALVTFALAHAQQGTQRGVTSYMPIDIKEPFATTMTRMKAAQPAIQKRQADLLAERYDLGNRAAAGTTMSRGKAVQEGVRAKLPAGTSWSSLRASVRPRFATATCSPRASIRCPTPITSKAAWSFPSSRSTNS
jgi:hypothetical protein